MKLTKLKIGIFIDDANMYFAQKQAGWKIDIRKLKQLLSSEFEIVLCDYHIAIPAKWDNAYKKTLNFIEEINNEVKIVSKPIKYIKTESTTHKKGDVDLEIALDVVRNIDKLDEILILSGDSDYVDLRKYVLECKKRIVFAGFRGNMSWEIKQGKYVLLDHLREYLEKGKKTPRCYPGRLLPDIYTKNRNDSQAT